MPDYIDLIERLEQYCDRARLAGDLSDEEEYWLIRNSMAALKELYQWQPMETAPRDGTKIAVWDTITGYTPWVYWEDDGWMSECIAWSGRPIRWMPQPCRPKGV